MKYVIGKIEKDNSSTPSPDVPAILSGIVVMYATSVDDYGNLRLDSDESDIEASMLFDTREEAQKFADDHKNDSWKWHVMISGQALAYVTAYLVVQEFEETMEKGQEITDPEMISTYNRLKDYLKS